MEQIHHATANKLYNLGHAVTICPCRLSPVAFQGAFSYRVEPSENEGRNLRDIVKSFKFNNCANSETGYNCTYWIS